jgi:hypothetical protein
MVVSRPAGRLIVSLARRQHHVQILLRFTSVQRERRILVVKQK